MHILEMCSIYKAMPRLTVGEIVSEQIVRKNFFFFFVAISLKFVVLVFAFLLRKGLSISGMDKQPSVVSPSATAPYMPAWISKKLDGKYSFLDKYCN
jgi:hypothetical protein